MVYFIEGSRNSGKSYISERISKVTGIRRFQYEFAYWFSEMSMSDNSIGTHQFAIGKESMLLQMIKDGLIKDKCIIDRGIFSVLTWGVLEGRISKEEGRREMDLFIKKGLMSNVKFIYLYGDNPKGDRANKDHWDKNESSRKEESDLMNYFIEYSKSKDRNISIVKIENSFNKNTIDILKNIIN